MKLYTEENNYKLYEGNMLDLESVIESNSIDAIVTDPPYELGFMNKKWDSSGIAFQKETWEKCYNVLKPGGHMLVFGGARTFYRIACAIEDAGFEIRDTIMWLYGSGFCKGMNIGLAIDKRNGVESEIVGYTNETMPDFNDIGIKQKEISGINKLTFGQVDSGERKEQPIYKAQNEWNGWNTQLKPAYEPIIVARKPCEGSILDNIEKYGVGGINADECRIAHNEPIKTTNRKQKGGDVFNTDSCGFDNTKNHLASADSRGRFPSNIILTYDDSDFDEVCGGMPNSDKPNGSVTKSTYKNSLGSNGIYGHYSENQPLWESYNDSGSASRYFYCAKATTKDREDGLNLFKAQKVNDGRQTPIDNGFQRGETLRKNIHPTVKPCELMQYLIRLITPKNGVVLDPFNGSGSTGKACMWENKEREVNYKYIGIELTPEYLPISKSRIDYVINAKSVEQLKTKPQTGKGNLLKLAKEHK